MGKRVADLLCRMTLEEKVGQMNQFVGVGHIKTNESSLTEEELKNNTVYSTNIGLACIKHFVGGSQPINGTNGSPTDL